MWEKKQGRGVFGWAGKMVKELVQPSIFHLGRTKTLSLQFREKIGWKSKSSQLLQTILPLHHVQFFLEFFLLSLFFTFYFFSTKKNQTINATIGTKNITIGPTPTRAYNGICLWVFFPPPEIIKKKKKTEIESAYSSVCKTMLNVTIGLWKIRTYSGVLKTLLYSF